MPDQKWLKILQGEIKTWREAGIIDDNSLQAIETYYQGEQPGTDRFMSTLFTFGALLVGLGIILYIASNLQFTGPELKVAGIIALVLAFNISGYYLKFERQNYPGLGSALLFIGAFAYGGGIWLIAQIFQIPFNYADGFLYWLLGLLPFAALLKLRGYAVLSSLLLPVWLFVAASQSPVQWVYPIFWGVWMLTSWTVIRNRSAWAWSFQVLSACLWLGHFIYTEVSNGRADNPYTFFISLYSFIIFGILLYSVGMVYYHFWHTEPKRWSGFGKLSKSLGAFVLTLPFFPVTWSHHAKSSEFQISLETNRALLVGPFLDTGLLPIWAYGLTLLAGGILIWFYFKVKASLAKAHIREIFLLGLALFLSLIWLHVTPTLGPLPTSIICNTLLIGLSIGLLYLGYHLKHTSLFRLGLIFFSLEVLMRYTDTFWDILPHAIFFLTGGIILILGGVFIERQRRLLERQMKQPVEAEV